MLLHLSVENYVLIEKLDIDFNKGFSVITGETGAGKSILLGALYLILGKRADNKVLLDKTKKCILEGTFYIKNYNLKNFFTDNDLDYDDTVIIRREINRTGKSRAFINDTPVNLGLLKNFSTRLIDIHSQNKVVTLNNSDFQLDVVDNFANHKPLLDKYKAEYFKLNQLKLKLIELENTEEKLKNDQDYYQFLYDELEKANLQIDEDEHLEQEIKLLNNSEKIKNNLFNASNALSDADDNLLNSLNDVYLLINQISDVFPDIRVIEERFNSNLIELKDIAYEIDKIYEQINFDPERIDIVSQRLDLIYHLENKHKVANVSELLEVEKTLNEKLKSISSFEEDIKNLKKEIEVKTLYLKDLSNKISANRKKVIPDIEKKIVNLLKQLGIPDAEFKVEINQLETFTKDGRDKLRFLFNANKGLKVMEVSEIASGGELSRIMLSIKSLISEKNLLPTVFFDEIDNGVSGKIAVKVGQIMKKMSKNMQVFAITHLPQIASQGDSHYFVYKTVEDDITKSKIKLLDSNNRTKEIAKMLSGEKVTDAAFQNAKDLLNN